jgi:hypothetical protein
MHACAMGSRRRVAPIRLNIVCRIAILEPHTECMEARAKHLISITISQNRFQVNFSRLRVLCTERRPRPMWRRLRQPCCHLHILRGDGPITAMPGDFCAGFATYPCALPGPRSGLHQGRVWCGRVRSSPGAVPVAACKANPLGLQTRAFMDQHSMRICHSAGQPSVQTSQHSYANGLQTRLRATHHCEWHNHREINAFIGTPCFAAV